MNNITKIENGFLLNEVIHMFQDFESNESLVKYELLSENQLHIGTSNGVIFLDLSVSIDGVHYEDINEFIKNIF